MTNQTNNKTIVRPPVVAIMGHIDHGKSTLLDYIRKTNIVDREAGGITQAISAYEVNLKDEKGQDRKITFVDTPGHEAFSGMRERGARAADIAILIVSAEDGVKPQTIEAWKTIVASKTPCIVAINKIDKPGANIEKVKMGLAEHEIYIEGYGGSIPFALVSAKVGTGVDELLALINLVAEMENFTGNPNEEASGFVIEANRDAKRGVQATLIIKNGTLKKGAVVVVGQSMCPVRMIENFLGKQVDSATFSSPVRLAGFDGMPKVGEEFLSFAKKEEAQAYIKTYGTTPKAFTKSEMVTDDKKKVIPLVLKADVSGSLEALEKEIGKIKCETACFKIIGSSEGSIGENDIKSIGNADEAIILGFNVKAPQSVLELAERRGVTVASFDIIYKMTEWLEAEIEKRKLKFDTEETTGKAKIIKAFSRTKERQIIGGKVMEGKIALNKVVKILRKDFEIGRGKIVNLEKSKMKVNEVEEGAEFGMMIESKTEIVGGDTIESFNITQK